MGLVRAHEPGQASFLESVEVKDHVHIGPGLNSLKLSLQSSIS